MARLSSTRRVGFSAAFALLLGAACGARVEGTDSSTHWLSHCESDNDCSSGLSCECGSCTKVCDSDQACDGLGNATCAPAQCGATSVVACAKACSSDSQCSSGECTNGACAFATQCIAGECVSTYDASSSVPTSGGSNPTCEGEECTSDPLADSGAATTTGAPEPSDCPAMDVVNSGDECVGTPSTYWDGAACVTVTWCSCFGNDCESMFADEDDCRRRYAACIDEVPECTNEIEFVTDTDLNTLQPAERGYHFEVVGEAAGQFEDSTVPPPFSAFTRVVWGGADEGLDSAAEGLTLTFLGDDEDLLVTLSSPDASWELPARLATLELGLELEVRLERESGPVQLQVRETDARPLLWAVQSDPNIGSGTAWAFDELNARVTGPLCKHVNEECNWLFALEELVVGFSGEEVSVPPMGAAEFIGPGEADDRYMVVNSHSMAAFGPAYGEETCARGDERHDGFVVWRAQ